MALRRGERTVPTDECSVTLEHLVQSQLIFAVDRDLYQTATLTGVVPLADPAAHQDSTRAVMHAAGGPLHHPNDDAPVADSRDATRVA